MLSRINGSIWEEEEGTISWTRNTIEGGENHKDEMGSLTTFKSMLEDDNWGYINSTNQNPSSHHDFQSIHNHHEIIRDLPFSSNPISSQHLLLQPPSIDSSSSCSQSSVFNLDPSQVQSFLSPKSSLSSLLNVVYNNNNNNNNPFENSFDLSCESGFLMGNQNSSSNLTGLSNLISQTQMGTPDLCSNNQFSNTHLTNWSENGSNIGIGSNSTTGFGGFENPANSDFLRSKVLKPLEILPPVGSQPTLFQKRAALRQNSSGNDKNGNLVGLMSLDEKGKREMDEQVEKWRNTFEEDEGSIDGSGLNYDTDEAMENNKFEDSIKNGGNNSNANSTITNGGQKGKKKGLPAKNLMAERRRRKKLNDRLYMLRSVVPKISKMDRASILGDAIEYLKELLQKINDLHNELETTPLGSSIPPSSSFHPSSPTPATLPCRVKEELCSSSLSSPNNQPARVEVRAREGRAVNIHMFCSRRPGLLLSTMRALDDIGIDIQQAVISCFNGFALDVFRAEQNKEGMDIPPEEIKAVLLSSAGFIGTA